MREFSSVSTADQYHNPGPLPASEIVTGPSGKAHFTGIKSRRTPFSWQLLWWRRLRPPVSHPLFSPEPQTRLRVRNPFGEETHGRSRLFANLSKYFYSWKEGVRFCVSWVFAWAKTCDYNSAVVS